LPKKGHAQVSHPASDVLSDEEKDKVRERLFAAAEQCGLVARIGGQPGESTDYRICGGQYVLSADGGDTPRASHTFDRHHELDASFNDLPRDNTATLTNSWDDR